MYKASITPTAEQSLHTEILCIDKIPQSIPENTHTIKNTKENTVVVKMRQVDA